MSRITSTNDFVIKFANINGSGSASANELLARAILRMGIAARAISLWPMTGGLRARRAKRRQFIWARKS